MLPNKKSKPNILRNKVFAVYGLGNVGGPLASAWLRVGAKVIGVDISKKLISEIKSGKSHKKEPYISDTFSKSIKNGTLTLTSNGIQASKDADIKIIAVPVGLKNNGADLSALVSVSKDIAAGLKKDDAVLISPSVPPGTTEKIILPILENGSKLVGGKHFYLIYNPERIFEGRALEDIECNYPAIVAGLNEKSLLFAEDLLKIISKKGVLKMSSLANAETEKLFEGVYRDVNIALANELATFCESIGVDFWESRKGANSQPYCHLHYPGTGVGGLCIPVYPKFVLQEAKKTRKHLKITEFARKINDTMPKKCVNDAIKLLSDNHKSLNKAKISVLGLGFRGEVTDSRLSPTYVVVREFLKKGCNVTVHDPYILHDDLLPSNVSLSNDMEKIVTNADLIFISTDHKLYAKLNSKSFAKAKKPLLIFDGRNILNRNNFVNDALISIGVR